MHLAITDGAYGELPRDAVSWVVKGQHSPCPSPLPHRDLECGLWSPAFFEEGGSLAKQRTFLLFVCLFFRLLSAKLMEQETALGVSKTDLRRLGRGVEESEHSFKRSIKVFRNFPG